MMARAVPKKEGVRQILIVDNASWHRAARVKWHHFKPKFLPGYSPDYNPIERLWLRLKADCSGTSSRAHIRGTDRASVHGPQEFHRRAGQNCLHLLYPEMTFGITLRDELP
jgi:hypothetical protein